MIYTKKETPVDKYSITTSVTGGRIDSSVTGIAKGESKTIKYSPSKGYKLKSVTVDGRKVDITKFASSDTFSDISADHEIKVVYEKETTGRTTTTGTTVISTSPKGLGPKTGDTIEMPFWIMLGGTAAVLAVIAARTARTGKKDA